VVKLTSSENDFLDGTQPDDCIKKRYLHLKMCYLKYQLSNYYLVQCEEDGSFVERCLK